MTLHEAIQKVLKQNNQAMTARQIADIINAEKIYTRGDGYPVPASQISARVNNYPSLFLKGYNEISLVEYNPLLIKRNVEITLDGIIKDLNTNLSIESGLKDIERLLFVVEYIVILFGNSKLEIKIVNRLKSPRNLTIRIALLNRKSKFKDCFETLIKYRALFTVPFIDYYNSMFLELKGLNEEQVYLTLLNYIQSSNVFEKHGSGQFITPDFINEIMVSIIQPQKGDIVYDPAAGRANSLLAAFKYEKVVKLIGQEIDSNIATLARLNLILSNCVNFDFFQSNSIFQPAIKKGEADIIISNPPFGGKLLDHKLLDFERITHANSLDFIFFELMLSRLNPKSGKMVVVLPNGFLSSSKSYDLRKKLLGMDILEAVITLPPSSFLPYAGVDTNITVINHNKVSDKRNKVLFIDGKNTLLYNAKLKEDNANEISSYVREILSIYNNSENESTINHKLVTIDSIIENDFLISPQIYTSKLNELIDEFKKSEDIVKLETILETTKKYNPEIIQKRELVKMVQIGDLNENETDFDLNLNVLSSSTRIPSDYFILKSSAILIARIGFKLKPTYFDYTGNSIAIKNNIIALSINKVYEDRVSTDFLISQLNSEFFKSQLKLIQSNDSIPSISIKQLLNLKLPLPKLSEQYNQLARFKEENANKFRLINFIEEIKLSTSANDTKLEIERFALNLLSVEYVDFKNEFDFEKFPFSQKEISTNQTIKPVKDFHQDEISYYLLLLINKSKRINGIIRVQTNKIISFEQYSEINAYADFLISASEFIIKQVASDSLAKFAHTSKNFFLRLVGEIKAITETQNENLKNLFRDQFVESERVIDRKRKEGKDLNQYLLLNKLEKISNQVSSIASFYQITDLNFKEIMHGEYSNFNIIEVLRSCIPLAGNIEFLNIEEEIVVHSKKTAVKQSIVDILQNAIKYSTDRSAVLNISQNETYVTISVTNKVNSILPKETYEKLGVEWLTAQNESGISKGLYWAMQAINNSNGRLKLATYDKYSNENIFEVVINLKKQ